MDRINLFNPFVSKADHHEDRATQSIAVTLKYSPMATAALRNYLCVLLQSWFPDKASQENEESKEAGRLDILKTLNSTTCIPEVHTQVRSLPAKDVERILSCALIDDIKTEESRVIPIGTDPRDGNARYDLVVHFPDMRLVVIFETKKFDGRPGSQQLRPTESDLNERKILPYAILVSCRELLSRFLALRVSGQAGQAEASVIQDLVDFFEDIHPDLSPVLPLSDLNSENKEVIMLRLARAMEGLLDSEKAGGSGFYRGDSSAYYIEPGFGQLQRINLNLLDEEDGLKIQVAGHFGDTQSQATIFFSRGFSVARLAQLAEKENWDVGANFHIHFMGTHLVWYATTPNRLGDYLEFWNCPDGPGWARLLQTSKEDLKVLLSDLRERELIIREGKEREEDERMWDTNREKFNVAPGLSIIRLEQFSTLKKQDMDMDVSRLVRRFATVVKEILDASGISEEEIEKSALNSRLFTTV